MISRILTSALLFCLFSVAWAADDQYLLTEKTYKVLSEAQQNMVNEQYGPAEKQLKALVSQTAEGSYDRAVVQQTIGYLYADQGQYGQAAKAFQLALDSKALPDDVSHSLRYNLAQLLIADGQYKKGIALLETWLKKEAKPGNSVYVLLATAHYQVSQHKSVVTYIKKAIEGDKDPKEDWYRLLLSAHLSLKQNKSASAVLETLIARYPHRKEYWQQLSAIYLQRELEMRALAVRLLADRLDLGDAKTLINLADMYRYLAIPYKSGQLLAKSMEEGVIDANYDHLDKLASSWLAARELDLAAQTFQRMLSLDISGQSHLRLAQVYVAMEQWQETAGVLADLPTEFKGNDQGKAQMMLGTSYFHLADYNKAKSAFAKALTVESTRSQASQWLQHIDDVLEKQNDAEAS